MKDAILLFVYIVLLFALMLSRYRAIGKRGAIRPRDRQIVLDRLNKFVRYDLFFTKMNYFKDCDLETWLKCSSARERLEINSALFKGEL